MLGSKEKMLNHEEMRKSQSESRHTGVQLDWRSQFLSNPSVWRIRPKFQSNKNQCLGVGSLPFVCAVRYHKLTTYSAHPGAVVLSINTTSDV